jgi:hypothetical protein
MFAYSLDKFPWLYATNLGQRIWLFLTAKAKLGYTQMSVT